MGGRQCWGLGHWMALPGWGWAPVPASPLCASEGAHLGIWAQPPQGSPGGTGLDRGAAASESAAGVGVPIQDAARRAPSSGCVDPCTHRKMVARLPGRKPNGVTFSATGTSRGSRSSSGLDGGSFSKRRREMRRGLLPRGAWGRSLSASSSPAPSRPTRGVSAFVGGSGRGPFWGHGFTKV